MAEFRAFYDIGYPWSYANVLQSSVFLGLGNHDDENNLGSCQSFSWDKNRCAKNAINLIRGAVFAGYMKNMPVHTIESFDAGSLAYSWNRGRYHFMQLHNDASYTVPALEISPSTQWLRSDLALAKARGQSIVINVHNPCWRRSSCRRWMGTLWSRFLQVICARRWTSKKRSQRQVAKKYRFF